MGEIAFSILVSNRDSETATPMIELEPRIIWGESL
jgi:hypothetical protein